MIGGMCGVVRDIIPYGIAHGNRSVLQGLNLIGLRRKNIPLKEIYLLTDAYNEIFKNENLTENLKNLTKKFRNNELVKEIIEFMEKDNKKDQFVPRFQNKMIGLFLGDTDFSEIVLKKIKSLK